MNALPSLVELACSLAPLSSLQLSNDAIFFQAMSISAVGTQETELYPRSKAPTLKSEETTRDEEMPSTNASRSLDKGKWSSLLCRMVVGVPQLLT